MKVIDKFNGQFAFLSNFWLSPIEIPDGTWLTVEHLYQGRKTNNLDDRERIRKASSPGRAKQMGRNVTLRTYWEETKVEIMLRSVRLKFEQNSELGKKLLATGDAELIEGNNWHDNEWGNCNCSRCKSKTGKNLLGWILMQVRQELEEEVV